MTGVFANHVNLAVTANNFALIAHFLNRRTHLHIIHTFPKVLTLRIYLHAQPQAVIFGVTGLVLRQDKVALARQPKTRSQIEVYL